jgi:hypothetical protein
MRRLICLAAAGLALAACGVDARTEAAKDVRQLLVAAEQGDAAAFEAGIDRKKLKANLRAQVLQHARAQGIDIEPRDAVIEAMIGPDALRAVRAGAAEPPTADQIATALQVEDASRACLKTPAGEGCALTFEKQGQRWKLVDVRTGALELKAGETG